MFWLDRNWQKERAEKEVREHSEGGQWDSGGPTDTCTRRWSIERKGIL